MRTSFFAILMLAALFITGCAPAAPQPAIQVSNAVIMASNKMMGGMDDGQAYAAYMQIKNTTAADDQLLSVSSTVADAELHETTVQNDVASMQQVESINIPAGASVELKSGALHIMLMNANQDLKIGDTVSLTLKFKNAGEVIVSAVVTAR